MGLQNSTTLSLDHRTKAVMALSNGRRWRHGVFNTVTYPAHQHR